LIAKRQYKRFFKTSWSRNKLAEDTETDLQSKILLD